jgi:hypothetical protein
VIVLGYFRVVMGLNISGIGFPWIPTYSGAPKSSS